MKKIMSREKLVYCCDLCGQYMYDADFPEEYKEMWMDMKWHDNDVCNECFEGKVLPWLESQKKPNE